MKWLKIFVFILPMAMMMSCGGKSDGSQSETDSDSINHSRLDEQMVRTHADTIACYELAKAYFRALQDKEFDKALDMLYSPKPDGLYNLSDEERHQLIIVYNSVPVYDYYVTDLKMFSEKDTEITVRVVMFSSKPGDDRPNYIDYKMCPLRIDGKWKLSVPIAFKETGDSVNNYDIKEQEHIQRSL